ncbi:unnamed protein product (mitochondrion) [Plasmodiophora brassicae]|uniref:Protein kinase domain-containing protein n=1 Tax=Plasmodiophora brassicae TaxID=37360 RepID=A0A0G4IHL1_PLABS|nr:hypothetical protein PBRA_000454 [Plasmodiophora brassicae]SPQ93066.1 unnamed protein product [Plasmodiophora brassicae]
MLAVLISVWVFAVASADHNDDTKALVDAATGNVIANQFVLHERLARSEPGRSRALVFKPSVRIAELLFEYEIHRQFAKGGFGEVWTAIRIRSSSSKGASHFTHTLLASNSDEFIQDDLANLELFVLKRFLPGDGRQFSALREEYFGRLLKGSAHIARFEECFTEGGDYWCVFHHEGRSLYRMLYDIHDGVVHPSAEWRQMKLEKEVESNPLWTTMQSIAYQVLQAVAECHDKSVTHRDVKPSNILLSRARTQGAARHQRNAEYLTLGDFGSAVDYASLKRYYPIYGPSKEEETLDYAPPEVLFSQNPYALHAPTTYDLWSIGVLLLEMVLGTSDVFRVRQRTRAIIDRFLEGESEDTRSLAVKFRAFFEYCIYDPRRDGRPLDMRGLDNAQACSNADFQALLATLDPIGIGAPSANFIRLVRRLLQWRPTSRITAQDALEHAWFHGPFLCDRCKSEFEFKKHLDEHRCGDGIESQRMSVWDPLTIREEL